MELNTIVKQLNEAIQKYGINLFADAGNKFTNEFDKDFGEFEVYGKVIDTKDNKLIEFVIMIINKVSSLSIYAYNQKVMTFP